MNPKIQRRIQRYGWDLAADDYEPLWQMQLADARAALLDCASVGRGEHVLDVACGTGLVTLDAAVAAGSEGRVLGVDLAGRMVDAARLRASTLGSSNVAFARMDAEKLELPDCSFDVALCALGLMYVPDPVQALQEMRRVLRPGGRFVIAVWGERSNCGWAPLFEIVDAEVSSEVCPLFFHLGRQAALPGLCREASLKVVEQRRVTSMLCYPDAESACDAAFIGGPVALAWSRFTVEARNRVRARYIEAIAPWRHGDGYRIPGEFVIVAGRADAGDPQALLKGVE